MPVTSVDVERSFYQYKHLMNKQHENLTPKNTKQFIMYFNGDLEKRFNDCKFYNLGNIQFQILSCFSICDRFYLKFELIFKFC